MSEVNPYTPVSCALHSEYELLIMHRQMIQLRWRDEAQQVHSARVLPIDLLTEQAAEYLVVQNNNQSQRVRLDHILDFEKLI